MGQYFEEIPKSLMQWILDQKMFWVASAPLSGNGHVNVSPKGATNSNQEYQCFGVLDQKTFWYQELTGSGNETVAHIYESGNGRVTIMFNAFEGPPRILRMFGHGRVLEVGTAGFETFVTEHKVDCIPGTRSIIILDIHQVGTSCGFSVPFYDFKEFRPVLNDYFKRKAEKEAAGNENESMPRYWALKNAWSMDGLPGLETGQRTMKKEGITPLKKMVGPLAPTRYQHPNAGYSLATLLLISVVAVLSNMAVLWYMGFLRRVA